MDAPKLMGILNVTPTVFPMAGAMSGPTGGRPRPAMVAEGADLIDIGGESTRPGAEEVPAGRGDRTRGPVIAALAARDRRAAEPRYPQGGGGAGGAGGGGADRQRRLGAAVRSRDLADVAAKAGRR
jgi:dihydropteroate synthase